MGYSSLVRNTLGEENTAVGSAAMLRNVLGSFNTGLGYQALYSNINGAQKAELLLTAIDGKELQRIPIAERGEGSVELRTGNYPNGSYQYSLIVDGQVIKTHRMVIRR